jgi:hypothetical protein
MNAKQQNKLALLACAWPSLRLRARGHIIANFPITIAMFAIFKGKFPMKMGKLPMTIAVFAMLMAKTAIIMAAFAMIMGEFTMTMGAFAMTMANVLTSIGFISLQQMSTPLCSTKSLTSPSNVCCFQLPMRIKS